MVLRISKTVVKDKFDKTLLPLKLVFLAAKPLFNAIQRQREARSEITGQASKNGRPEVRAPASR